MNLGSLPFLSGSGANPRQSLNSGIVAVRSPRLPNLNCPFLIFYANSMPPIHDRCGLEARRSALNVFGEHVAAILDGDVALMTLLLGLCVKGTILAVFVEVSIAPTTG